MAFKICSICHINKLISEYSKNKNNRDKLDSRCKICYNQYKQNWHINNPNYWNNQYANNVQYRIKKSIYSIFTNFMYKGYYSRRVEQLLGCDRLLFMSWIQFTFIDNMAWFNYGKEWEFDHVIPLSNYDLTDNNQLLAATHYSNIRASSREDNLCKGNSVFPFYAVNQSIKYLAFKRLNIITN
jgi:hypothetical protein